MSLLVPEEVRRLFQVLTGEDMTDADEDALFAVAERLESGAVAVETLGPVVGEVVGRVRGGFSGKAADRFAQRLAAFGPVLESGGVGLRELAGFVRNLALQVQYLKFVTVGGLLLLVAEVAWAVAMAGPTGGASMAWLAARFAVMRLLLTRWWGQLFMRLAMSQVVGVGLQVVMDAGAQGVQFALGTREKWDAAMSEMAVGVGSFSGLLAVPLSALGNVVGNAIAKVLVRGLGDKIDVEVLAAAAKHAAEEHAERYPVASVARFADVVSKDIEDFTGMSVRAMWAVRFGHGLGEAFEEGLTEMLGEAGYGAMSGQGAQWNPFSFTAGVSEAIGSGVGNLAGLALRGELVPAGRARDSVGEAEDSAVVYADTTDLLKVESGLRTAEKPGSPGGVPSVDSGVPVPGPRTTASEPKRGIGPGAVGPGLPEKSGTPTVGSGAEKALLGGVSEVPDGKDGGVVRADVDGVPRAWAVQSVGGLVRGASVPEPRIAMPNGEASGGGPTGEDAGASAGKGAKAGASGIPGDSEVVSWQATVPGVLREQDRPETPPPPYGAAEGAHRVGSGAPNPGHGFSVGDSGAEGPPPSYSPDGGDGHSTALSSAVDSSGEYAGGSLASDSGLAVGDSPQRDAHAPAAEPPGVAGMRPDEHRGEVRGSEGGMVLGDSGVDAVRRGEYSRSHTDVGDGITLRGGEWVPAVFDVSSEADSGIDSSVDPTGEPDSSAPHGSSVPSDAPVLGAGPVGLPGGGVRVSVPTDTASGGGLVEFVRGYVGDAGPGPVVLVPEAGSSPGVVVSSGQASEVARGVGRDVVALMPGQARRGPQWTLFAPDGSRPRPVGGPEQIPARQAREGGDRLDVLGTSSASVRVPEPGPAVAASVGADAATGKPDTVVSEAGIPGQPDDLRVEVERAYSVTGPRAVAERIVQGTHDVVGLARGAAGVSVDDVIALVAARVGEFGRAEGVRFSRELAVRLGSVGSGLTIQAGGRPDSPAEVQVSAEPADGIGGEADDPGEDARWSFGPQLVEAAEAWVFDPSQLDFGGQLDFGDGRGSWWLDPVVAEQSLGSGWDAEDVGWGVADGAEASAGEASAGEASAGEASVGVDEDDGLGLHSGDQADQDDLVREEGRAEARRARDEGKPYSGAALGRKFGKSREWGRTRLAEIRAPGVPRPSELDAQVREAAREEVRRANEDGKPYTHRTLAQKFGKSVLWGKTRLAEITTESPPPSWQAQERQREAGRVEARRARDEGETPYSARALGKKFGRSREWGQARLREIENEGGAGRSELIEQKREEERAAARAEARRARDEGKPYTGDALGKKFGKSRTWGWQRIGEIWNESGAPRPDLVEQQRAAARAEARRAQDAGQPYSGPALGRKFGKSKDWGRTRILEISSAPDALAPGLEAVVATERVASPEVASAETSHAARESTAVEPSDLALPPLFPGIDVDFTADGENVSLSGAAPSASTEDTAGGLGGGFGGTESIGQGSDRKRRRVADADERAARRLLESAVEAGKEDAGLGSRESLREAARQEARRARDAGQPYSSRALGEKFGKSKDWGRARLREISDEGRHAVQSQAQLQEAARVEARRARDAGQPYSGGALAAKFGQSTAWGWRRMKELKDEGGVTVSELEEREREAARVEARRASDGGKPYSGAALGAKFGRSKGWGSRRLNEIAVGDGVNRTIREERDREAARTEARHALDAGRPYTARELAEKFGRGKDWARVRLAEISEEGEVSRTILDEREREAGRAEARRARDAGKPHKAETLGKKFGRGREWGAARLSEIRNEAGGSAGEVSASRGDVPTVGVESADVAGWSVSDLRVEVEWAYSVGGPRDVAMGVVQGTHDVVMLARGGAEVSLDDVVALVAARVGGFGRAEGVRFSRELAVRLGSVGAGLMVQAGAGLDVGAGSASVDESGDVVGWWSDASVWRLGESGNEVGPWWLDPVVAEQELGSGWDSGDVGWGVVDVAWTSAAAESVGDVERSRLVTELGEAVDTLRGLLIGAPEGYRPGLGESVERWSAMLRRRGGLDGAGPAGLRKRVQDAGALVERVRSELGHLAAPGVLPGTDAGLTAGSEHAVPDAWRLLESIEDVSREVAGTGSPGARNGRKRSRADEEIDEQAARSGPNSESVQDGAGLDSGASLREVARVEARRARDVGLAYNGAELGKKFGRSKAWGGARLKEVREQEAASRPESEDEEQLREAARVEARRARDEGKPYSGAALGKKFGKNRGWGWWRLEEIRGEGRGLSRTALEEREREAARVEARHARDEGKPYSGTALGKKFGKDKRWGGRRLDEIKNDVSRAGSAERDREAARAEARRARDAGQPYTTRALASKFGKNKDWGRARLAEISEESGASRAVLDERQREAGRAEARRARDVGEPYKAETLGKKFGRSRQWGAARLREIQNPVGGLGVEHADVAERSLPVGGSVGVAEWSVSDLRVEVEWAYSVGGPRDVAMGVVQGTHDVVMLARGGAEVSLDDVVALVAARVGGFGRAEGVRFSRELAVRLGSVGSGLMVQAGAGPDAGTGSGRVDESAGGAGVAAGPANVVGWWPVATAPSPVDSGDLMRSRRLDPMVAEQSLGFGWQAGDSAWALADMAGASADGVSADVGRSWLVSELAASSTEDMLGDGEGAEPNGQGSGLGAESLRQAARQEARRARDAGEDYTGLALGKRFAKSKQWGLARLREIRDQDAAPPSKAEERVREAARVEARRARDAGEPHSGRTLGEKFGKSRGWGWWRIEEIKGEGGVPRLELEERVREAARVEARRARDAGEPHSGRTLGEKFGKSKGWGFRRLGEINSDGVSRTVSDDREREAARAEARRARDAGKPYSVEELAGKFGRSKDWARARLVEIGVESDVSRVELDERERAAGRVEAHRARDAGKPYTGQALGAKFGRGRDWGAARLREIRNAVDGSVSGSPDLGGDVATAGGSSLDVTVAERSRSLTESTSVAGWTESDLQDEVERASADSGGSGAVDEVAAASADEWGPGPVAPGLAESGDSGAKWWLDPVVAEQLTTGWGAGDAGLVAGTPAGVPVSQRAAGGGAVSGVAAESADETVSWSSGPGLVASADGAFSWSFDPGFVGPGDGAEAWWLDPVVAEQLGSGSSVGDAGLVPGTSVGESAVGVNDAERSQLVAELGVSVDALRGLLVGAPVGYLPGLRDRVELWLEMLGRGGFDGAELAGLRKRVKDAGALVERVRNTLEPHVVPDLLPKMDVDVAADDDQVSPPEAGPSVSNADTDRGAEATDPISVSSGRKRSRVDDAVDEGAARRLMGPAPVSEAGKEAARLRPAEPLREAARAEARRARDEGKPHTGQSLGAKFGRGRDWGAERLKEIRAQDDVSRSELADSEQLRTEARAEARRARDAGEPYFGMALGAKF
ncbi:WXG100-like domain-containing protein, partial [Saccharopolyspora phatthalungensis]|nr:biotin operon repressor [Saccharopolyspora phatthalungensis]